MEYRGGRHAASAAASAHELGSRGVLLLLPQLQGRSGSAACSSCGCLTGSAAERIRAVGKNKGLHAVWLAGWPN